MKCLANCEWSIVQSDNTGGDELLRVFCEHLDFPQPTLVAEGLESYLREKPIDWKPRICPLRGGE